jgi:hypothetical protein
VRILAVFASLRVRVAIGKQASNVNGASKTVAVNINCHFAVGKIVI